VLALLKVALVNFTLNEYMMITTNNKLRGSFIQNTFIHVPCVANESEATGFCL